MANPFLSCCAAVLAAIAAVGQVPAAERPNVILLMADDLGWGDTGYNGNATIRTPNLDAMARTGVRFERWYANSPVCSPTRGGCLTGRHPYRYGIFFANSGHMRPAELTLAEALRNLGYATGHFGKWHLGTLTKTVLDSNRGGPPGVDHFSPPWHNGFEECFSTEARIPTWDPMLRPVGVKAGAAWWNPVDPATEAEPFNTYYWNEAGQMVTENLRGDDSRIIMDRAVPFLESAVARGRPFFAVVWFHAPHWPVVAGPEFRRLYADFPQWEQNHFGCVTAMDEQIGRLRHRLRQLGVADNTMVWFCSDNGPAGQAGKAPGSAGPFRGRKGSLFEGGVRVPGLLEWPACYKTARVIDAPCCTLDYFPTIMAALGQSRSGAPEPVDGINLLPLLEGTTTMRASAIGFESRNQMALTEDRHKLISDNGGKTFMLFDLQADRSEQHDLAAEHPAVVRRMADQLARWRASCARSRDDARVTPGPKAAWKPNFVF